MTIDLSELNKDLKRKKIRGLALDIDETLSFTIGYWVDELNIKFGNPDNLSAKEIYSKYRLAQNVPFWQTKEALDWMDMARKSNDIQEILPLIENSNKIVQKINKIVPIVAYLTIRSEGIIKGTEKWLEKHGFPKAPVIAKPEILPYEQGSSWKAAVLANLYPQVLGIIDDTPSVIDFLPKGYKGYVFLYNNVNHPLKGKKIIPCKNWDFVFEEVKNVFK